MLKKKLIIRQLKKDYTYNLHQLKKRFKMHEQTIRAYIKDSKNPLGYISKNPLLIWSEDLRKYLREITQAKKCSLEVGEFYCMSCKDKKLPFDNIIARTEINKNLFNEKTICPDCFCFMNKKISAKRLTSNLDLIKVVSSEELSRRQAVKSSEKTQFNKKSRSSQKESNKDKEQESLFNTDKKLGSVGF